MTDIQKMIEEEAKEYADSNLWKLNTVGYRGAVIAGFQRGANFIQHANRWRKVSEELPEVLTDVLIKDSFGKIDIGCLYDNGIWSMTPPIDRKITEWKPI